MPAATLTFSADQRIKEGRDFRLTRETGRRLSQGVLIMNWVSAPEQRTSRLGVITSRRVGKAHDRNRARRLLRESFRNHQHEIAGPTDLILIARPSICGKGFDEVDTDFMTALRRARLLKTVG